MTEAQLQDAIVELAHFLGYRVAHFAPARTERGWRTACRYDAAGFPDLVLVGRNRVVFAEIKSEKGKVSSEQKEWLAALSYCTIPTVFQIANGEGGFKEAVIPPPSVYVWRPSDWKSGAVTKALQ